LQIDINLFFFSFDNFVGASTVEEPPRIVIRIQEDNGELFQADKLLL